MTAIARELRRNATSAERRLWQGLRCKQIVGFRFRRQVALGRFVADFVFLDARLVIEVDGATHSTELEIRRDAARTAAFAAHGFVTMRFTNDDVYRNLDGALETIRLRLIALSPRFDGLPDPPPLPAPTKGAGDRSALDDSAHAHNALVQRLDP